MLEICGASKPPPSVFYKGKSLDHLRNFEREYDIVF